MPALIEVEVPSNSVEGVTYDVRFERTKRWSCTCMGYLLHARAFKQYECSHIRDLKAALQMLLDEGEADPAKTNAVVPESWRGALERVK